jgi:dihydro-heme d1 dehydrogenase
MFAQIHTLLLAAILTVAATGAFAGPDAVPSGDRQWLARLDDGGQTLIIDDAASSTEAHRRRIETRDHVIVEATSLMAMPVRRSYLLALSAVAEIWEIALYPEAGPFHEGFVHSWETGMEESLPAEEGLFARQRIALDAPVVALALSPDRRNSVIATRADGTRVEINLVVRREVAILPPQ